MQGGFAWAGLRLGWLILMSRFVQVRGGIVGSIEKTLEFVESGSVLTGTMKLVTSLMHETPSWLLTLVLALAAVCLRPHWVSTHGRQVRSAYTVRTK